MEERQRRREGWKRGGGGGRWEGEVGGKVRHIKNMLVKSPIIKHCSDDVYCFICYHQFSIFTFKNICCLQ